MSTVESVAEVGKRGFEPWVRPESASAWLSQGRRQLQKIVRRAYQRPLAGNLADSSQEKLAKSPAMLDLAEHGLNDLLSQPIAATAPTPTKLLPHRTGVSAKPDLSLSHGCR